MTMKTKILLQLYVILFLFSKNIYAHSFGVQVYTPSLHLIKESYTFGDKYSYRLSESGQVVWMPGVKTFYDYGLDNISFNIKKIRIALELREEEMIAIMKLADFTLSKYELSALFRRADHKNYRPCGNQFLRNFLRGLAVYCRQ